MGFLSSLFGRGSAASPVQKMLAAQRANTERCISILAPCQTKEEILKAFGKAAELLSQSGDPLAQALQQAATVGGVLPLAGLLRVKEDCIKQCKAFLSATERGL